MRTLRTASSAGLRPHGGPPGQVHSSGCSLRRGAAAGALPEDVRTGSSAQSSQGHNPQEHEPVPSFVPSQIIVPPRPAAQHADVRASGHDDTILEASYRPVDTDSDYMPATSSPGSAAADIGISPGNPLTNGWVEPEGSRTWANASSVTADGGRGGHGGGGSGGSGGRGGDGSAEDGDGDFSMALTVVYSLIFIAMAHLWYTVHLVVEKPEVMSASMDKVLVWVGASSRALRKRWHQSVHATEQTQYNALCVCKEGRQSLSRRVFRPAKAQANSHGWRKLELGMPPAPSKFLVLPRPTVLSHPIFSRRPPPPPLVLLAIPEEGCGGSDALGSPLLDMSLTSSAPLSRQASSTNEGPTTPLRSPALVCAVEDSPFGEAALPHISAPPQSPAALHHARSQPSPTLSRGLSTAEGSQEQADDTWQPMSRSLRLMSRSRRQTSFVTPTRRLGRQVTWHGGHPSPRSDASCISPALNALPSCTLEGTYLFQSIQERARSHEVSSPDIVLPFGNSLPQLGSPSRTKSSPALDIEAGALSGEPAIRRSTSLHSLRSPTSGGASSRQLHSWRLADGLPSSKSR